MLSFGVKKTIIYMFLPTLLLLGLLEGTARIAEIWRPPWQVDYGWGFNPDSRLFVSDANTPGLMVTAEGKQVETVFQRQWFPRQKPREHFRVFFVGGSSINYAKDDISALGLQLSLKFLGRRVFEFINAGGCGYGSHRLTPIVAELLEYQPDLIIFYEAHNEFEEAEQLEWVRLPTLRLQRVVYASAFCRFLRDAAASRQISKMRRERNQQLLRMTPKENGSWQEKTFTPEQIDARMNAFEHNLTLIATMCKARNVPLLLSTVPSNLCRPRLSDNETLTRIQALLSNQQYEQAAHLARESLKHSGRRQASDTENEIIRKVAREQGVPIADVEARVIAAEPHHVPGETLFQDWCHLNGKGRKLMMEVFEEHILEHLNSTGEIRESGST